MRAWHERYPQVTFVGVHAPEFGFEHDLANVRRAVGDLDVPYPVVIDNNFGIWRGFDNHYWRRSTCSTARVAWPITTSAKRPTRRPNARSRRSRGSMRRSRGSSSGFAEPADWDALGSPETYFGAARGNGRTAGAPGAEPLDARRRVVAGRRVRGARLRFGRHRVPLRRARRQPRARGRGAVQRAARRRASGRRPRRRRRRVRQGTLSEPRMYQLVRRRGPVVEGTMEIAFDQPGVRAYVFTFGWRRCGTCGCRDDAAVGGLRLDLDGERALGQAAEVDRRRQPLALDAS